MSTDKARLLEAARAEPLWPRPPLWVLVLGALLATALVAFPLVGTTTFSHHVMILIFLYALMAQAWNVMAGLSGQISLGHAMFFGIGAYVTGVLFIRFGITPWIGILAGMAAAALAALAVGVPTLRLKGHYFAIATLLIGSSVQIIFQRWDFVGAASGLMYPLKRGTPWLHLQFHTSKVPYYYLALAAAALAFLLVWYLRRSRFGFRLQAVRDESEAAASLGIGVARHKVMAFMLSAAMMALAGAFYAQYILVLDPERVFSADISVIVVLMTVLGGSGTLWGPALGAAILVPLSEYSRIWLGGTGKTVDLIIYGLLIMAICMWRPAGVISLFADRLRRRMPAETQQ
ncbi:MAG: branched-chain amino acid ABC transporter permease [Hyphomicrobiaceae bacterium]|nr:branched-chain amino acid ABC transporter permease [Hyphomicrobiaceae bacterium]